MKTILTLLLTLSLSSCSWMTYFTVTNQSEQPVTVLYEWEPMAYGMFNHEVGVYAIQHEKPVTFTDTDTHPHRVRVVLPPQHVFRFGWLSNDTFTSSREKTKNELTFNLKHITITRAGKTTRIPKAQFDAFFMPDRGAANYTVR